MRQKSIGEVLRVTRENQGLEFAELQRLTKIQVKYLQALEYNDFDYIPDKEYARSFLKRYADVLELDSEVLLDAFDHNTLVAYYEAGEEDDSIGQLSRKSKGKTHKKRKNYLPLIYLLLIATAILVFVTYVVYTRVQHQIDQTTASSYSVVNSSSTESSTTSSTTSSSSTSSSSTTTPSSQLSVTGGGDTLEATLSGQTEATEITLSVTDVTSWISVSETDLAGGVVLSAESPSVTTTIPQGTTSVTITLGVVQGVTVTVAGQNLDTSALTSQTGTITLTIQE